MASANRLTTRRLILASASEGRRDLLRRAGFEFEVMPSGVEEPSGEGVTDPRAYVHQVAWMKAAAVAGKVSEGIVLAADSVGWQGGEIIGKPTDRDDARRILRRLSGTTHELWTGVCLWLRPEDVQVCWQERSLVQMKALSDAELESYLDTGAWEGKSGAYAIQEAGDPFLTVLEGSVSNVVGLPVETLSGLLSRTENFAGSRKLIKDLKATHA
jgi:septum formation protein